MNSTTEATKLIAAEAEAAAALADVQRLEPEADKLATDLEATRTQLREAHRRRAEAQKVLDARAREPKDRAEYEAVIARLKVNLYKLQYPGDARSVTRARVRADLERLERDTRLTTAERLANAKRLAFDLSDRRDLDRRHFATVGSKPG